MSTYDEISVPTSRDLEPQRVTQLRVLRSEWTKLRTLRSSAWSLLAAAALIVAVGVLVCMARNSSWHPSDTSSFDPTATSLTGVYLAIVAVGALGVLVIAGEYSTGLIRLTLTAVPKRQPVLWGKAATLALLTAAVCLPATLIAFLGGQSILSAHHLGTTLGHPGTARAILGSTLFLVGVGLLGLGLGGLFRNTAAAIASLFGMVFVVPILVGFLPSSLSDHASKYLPYSAGTAVMNATPGPDSLAPWAGLGVFFLYVAAALGLAALRLSKRDV